MKDFGLQVFLMTVGAAFILFVKGVFKARSEGDGFDFLSFVRANVNRLALLGFGLLVVGTALYFDAAGLQQLLAALPVAVQIGSPLVVGAALAGAVLIVPEKKAKGMED